MAAPIGNKNATKNKPFLDAINRALKQRDYGEQNAGKTLREIAEALIDKAQEGEPWAIKEMIDRLDGRPKQDMDITADVDIGITQFVQQSEELRKKIRGQ
jgi:hypothetical protein